MMEKITGPKWDLTSEYADVTDPVLIQDLERLAIIFRNARILNKQLTNDSVDVAIELFKLAEETELLLNNISTYVDCRTSVNSQDEAAQQLKGELQNHIKQQSQLFTPLSVFEDTAEPNTIVTYLTDSSVAPASFRVQHSRKRRHENLSLREENLVSVLSQDGIHAWGNLYVQISSTLKCDVLLGNEQQQMGIAQASGLLQSPDAKQREAAFRGINAAWDSQAEACSASLNAQAGWRLEMCEQRGRQQPVHILDAPAHHNRITLETLDVLIQVAADYKPLAQRAARLKARAMGKAQLDPWDNRAPAPSLVPLDTPLTSFNSAIDLITDAYGQVDRSMGEFVQMMAARKWIEGTTAPGKRPGAFCTGFAKSNTPRVYMTYHGTPSDVITLAHELGHAYHGWVMRDLPLSQRSYGMSLAETASIFGETLVREVLLSKAQSAQERLNIQWEEMSALITYMLGVTSGYEFEKNFYTARTKRPLRPKELNGLMSDAWRHWYGDALREPNPLFWASTPHFHLSDRSFYNFPYLFGYLFSLGVYAKSSTTGPDFHQRYVALLRDTGRMSVEDIASKHLDVRLDTPDFWSTTIDFLATRVDAFEVLLDEAT